MRYNGTVLPCCTFYAAEMPIGQIKTNIKSKFSEVDNIGLLDKSLKSKLIIGTIKEIFQLYIKKRKFHMFPIIILLIVLIAVTALAQSGLVAFIYPI